MWYNKEMLPLACSLPWDEWDRLSNLYKAIVLYANYRAILRIIKIAPVCGRFTFCV